MMGGEECFGECVSVSEKEEAGPQVHEVREEPYLA